MELTPNGIDYQVAPYSFNDPIKITIFLTVGVHTTGDILNAKEYLYLKYGTLSRVIPNWQAPDPNIDYTPDPEPGETCLVCDKQLSDICDHPKNGYCLLFRKQAQKDAKTFNMKPSSNS